MCVHELLFNERVCDSILSLRVSLLTTSNSCVLKTFSKSALFFVYDRIVLHMNELVVVMVDRTMLDWHRWRYLSQLTVRIA